VGASGPGQARSYPPFWPQPWSDPVIFGGSEQQARLILGAMAEVARSGGTELTALDRAALGSAAVWIRPAWSGCRPPS
jgi:hypothetical protein